MLNFRRGVVVPWDVPILCLCIVGTSRGPTRHDREHGRTATLVVPWDGSVFTEPSHGPTHYRSWSRGAVWPSTLPCQGRDRRFKSGRDRHPSPRLRMAGHAACRS